MEIALEEKYGFAIKRHVVQYYGTCADCSDAGGSSYG
jgi:Fe2+ or Zn2+ uptake regulation protein